MLQINVYSLKNITREFHIYFILFLLLYFFFLKVYFYCCKNLGFMNNWNCQPKCLHNFCHLNIFCFSVAHHISQVPSPVQNRPLTGCQNCFLRLPSCNQNDLLKCLKTYGFHFGGIYAMSVPKGLTLKCNIS